MRYKKKKRVILILLIIILTTVSQFSNVIAQPTEDDNRFNVVVVLDASNSMNYTDPMGLRFEAISQFTNLLAKKGNYVGGLVFSDKVNGKQNLLPVNDQKEKDDIIDMFRSVPAAGYTNIGEALLEAADMIEKDGNPDLPSVILFLSDGNTEMSTSDQQDKSLAQKADAIQKARDEDTVIYTVCLNANSSADITEMKQLSDSTHGEFKEVSKAEDLQEVFNTFYNLIYGTSTVALADSNFPSDGKIETNFDVPGLGVEEVNIVIYGKPSKYKLLRPDGRECSTSKVSSDTFTIIKLDDIIAGKWKLITEGTPGDSIKINMVYNTNLGIKVKLCTDEKIINPADAVEVEAVLKEGSREADNESQYVGYTAELQGLDAYGEKVISVPMQVEENKFKAKHNFDEGTYYFKVLVSGNNMEKESDVIGPITISSKAMTEEEKNNTAPTPVRETLNEDVYIWPFKGGRYSLDMKTLATDKQDSVLHYKIMSSSFIEGKDYSVDDDNILTVNHFSLNKGAFTIRAIDSGGLSCDINVVVKSHNVGLMAFIGICIMALFILGALGIGLYITLKKPFRGSITVQLYNNGIYTEKTRNPKRGRCKLSSFSLEPIGLDYNKSYFQATGQMYIILNTNISVMYNGQKTSKVRIQSGAEVSISVGEDDSKVLYIRFDSHMKVGASRYGKRPSVRSRR